MERAIALWCGGVEVSAGIGMRAPAYALVSGSFGDGDCYATAMRSPSRQPAIAQAHARLRISEASLRWELFQEAGFRLGWCGGFGMI